MGGRGEGGNGSGRREEGRRRKVGGGKTTKKDPLPTPVFFEVESPLLSGGAVPPFKHITGIHSELVALDTEGTLWKWGWKSVNIEPHPLVCELGLVGESVKLLSGKQLRVSVVTESGKVRSSNPLIFPVTSLSSAGQLAGPQRVTSGETGRAESPLPQRAVWGDRDPTAFLPPLLRCPDNLSQDLLVVSG